MNKTIPNICNLEPRYFQALLNALIKKNFYDDTEITYEYIINELYSDINDLVDINNELLSIEKVLIIRNLHFICYCFQISLNNLIDLIKSS